MPELMEIGHSREMAEALTGQRDIVSVLISSLNTKRRRSMAALLIELFAVLFEFGSDIWTQIQEGKMTKEEAIARLQGVAAKSSERRARLISLLDSSELEASYKRFDDALGPDPTGSDSTG